MPGHPAAPHDFYQNCLALDFFPISDHQAGFAITYNVIYLSEVLQFNKFVALIMRDVFI